MPEFNETRVISYDSMNLYCRYLDIDLPLSPNKIAHSGRFGVALKEMGMVEFPYRLRPADFVLHGILKPSLYVDLPKVYFDNWANFPKCPLKLKEVANTAEIKYNIEILPKKCEQTSDFIHPYDSVFADNFVKKFKTEVPKQYSENLHSNGTKYISAEAYLSYWQVYALADGFHLYRNATYLVTENEGKAIVLAGYQLIVNNFANQYAETFDRVSWYKTAVTFWQFSEVDCAADEVFSFVRGHTKVTIDILKQDLLSLLRLDAKWLSQIHQHGCLVLQNARRNLVNDIYLIYEQLQLLGLTAKDILEEFQSPIRSPSFSPLYEVLNVEFYIFKNSFTKFGQYYGAKIKKWSYECSDAVFNHLILIKGFDAWMRAFHDLHHTINDKVAPILFKQYRIVDALIVMSVRTEIVLREMFRPLLNENSDEDITKIFTEIGKLITDNYASFFDTFINEISVKTVLYGRPESLFNNIDGFQPKKKSKKDIYFIQAILKFITARNYFAHHAYKDDELNTKISELAGEVLKSLIATILYFQNLYSNGLQKSKTATEGCLNESI